jgi:glycosyltransferase involved in cell wall biosynthesis
VNVETHATPRVLLVVNSLGFGGTERMIERMTLHLTSGDRVRFTVCSLEDEGPIGARLRARGVEVVSLGLHGAVRQVLGGARAIRRMLGTGRYDLVHSFLYRSHCASRLARLGLGSAAPLISAERCLGDNRGWAARLVNRMTAPLSDRVVAVSRAVGERVVERDGVRPDRVAVVPNGIEQVGPDPRGRARLRRALGVGEGEVLFLYLGRLHHEKGPDLLLRGLAGLRQRVPHGWRCAVVGDGPERVALREAVAAAGLADRVRLTGARRRVAPWLEACDALILPSREEGMPVAALEAMMRGRAVAAFSVGGTPEVVRDGETGFLIHPGDTTALAGALERLAVDGGLRDRLGRRGREVARAEFSLEAMAEGTLREYRSLLTTTVPARGASHAAAAGTARGR